MKRITNIIDYYEFIDTNKEPEIILPDVDLGKPLGLSTVGDFVKAVPYYIRKVYYSGNNKAIHTELIKQFKVDGGVYVRPSNEIALAVTTYCNLACNNCNMLSNHKSTNSTMSIEVLENFIKGYKGDKADTMIRLTGGEPTILGTVLTEMIELLYASDFKFITVLTNGINNFDFPDYVSIENSSKQIGVKPEFNTQWVAPIDLTEFKDMPEEVYKGGCIQADVCGYCVDSKGLYYPCPTGAMLYPILLREGVIAIDYSTKSYNEAQTTRHKFFSQVCKYCGMFKKGGYHGLSTSGFSRYDSEPRSKFWEDIEL